MKDQKQSAENFTSNLSHFTNFLLILLRRNKFIRRADIRKQILSSELRHPSIFCFRNKTTGIFFYILVTVRLGIILTNNQLDAQFLLYIFISILYMFRTTLCSSSEESIVSIQHLINVILCRWPSGMQVGKELPDLHTWQSPTQSDIHQMLYWYNWLSWWWAQVCSKYVENRNK